MRRGASRACHSPSRWCLVAKPVRHRAFMTRAVDLKVITYELGEPRCEAGARKRGGRRPACAYVGLIRQSLSVRTTPHNFSPFLSRKCFYAAMRGRPKLEPQEEPVEFGVGVRKCGPVFVTREDRRWRWVKCKPCGCLFAKYVNQGSQATCKSCRNQRLALQREEKAHEGRAGANTLCTTRL